MRYVVMFPNGKSLVFYILETALTYAKAYNGILLNNPTVCMGMEESALQ